MDIATLYMDTYRIVQLLQTKGYSKEEAEGFIEAIREINLVGVATKQDLLEIRTELKEDITDLKGDMLKFQLVQTVAIIGVMIALTQLFQVEVSGEAMKEINLIEVASKQDVADLKEDIQLKSINSPPGEQDRQGAIR